MTRVYVSGGYLNVSTHGDGEIDNELPGGSGGYPDQGLPPGVPPMAGHLPSPPPGVWPPPSPSHPIVPIHPDNTLPVEPGTIWPTPGRPDRPDNSLPGGSGGQPDNGLPSQTFWMIAYCPSLGWRYIAVDPSLSAGMPLPPHAQPK
jgi:hypothetical protein